MEARTEPEEGSERVGKFSRGFQAGAIRELQLVKVERQRVPQCWEAQWPDFPKNVQSPPPGWRNPQPQDMMPWDDLASFERVADACQWLQGECVTRLVPSTGRELSQTYSGLEGKGRGDCAKMKTNIEKQRWYFRQFRYQEAEGPHEACNQLRELCHRWLEPESRTKEQILELLILEQFLTILPKEIQNQVQERGPETCAQAVALAEGFLLRQRDDQRREEQVPRTVQGAPASFPEVQRAPLNNRPRQFRKAARQLNARSGNSKGTKTASRIKEQFEHQQCRKKIQEEAAGRENHKRQRSHPCTECGKSFPWPSELAKHQKTHSGEKPYHCGVCGKSFGQISHLTRHQRIHSGDRPHPCSKCGKRFSCPSDLAKHLNIHTGEKPYRCDKCGKSFSQISHLTRHQRIHSGEKPHPCAECGEAFTQRAHLISHQRVHSGERPYRCTLCQKRFSHRSALTVHERIHMGQKPYACSECGKRFVASSALTRHQRTHSGEKPHICAECGRSFIQHSALTAHQRIHSGERPYPCSECGKRFTQPSDLTRHQKIHIGEKPFPCDECERKFARLSDLIIHRRIHTGEKPYRCIECGRRFRQRQALVKHQSLHHSKEEPQENQSLKPTEALSQANFDPAVREKEDFPGNLKQSSLTPPPGPIAPSQPP